MAAAAGRPVTSIASSSARSSAVNSGAGKLPRPALLRLARLTLLALLRRCCACSANGEMGADPKSACSPRLNARCIAGSGWLANTLSAIAAPAGAAAVATAAAAAAAAGTLLDSGWNGCCSSSGTGVTSPAPGDERSCERSGRAGTATASCNRGAVGQKPTLAAAHAAVASLSQSKQQTASPAVLRWSAVINTAVAKAHPAAPANPSTVHGRRRSPPHAHCRSRCLQGRCSRAQSVSAPRFTGSLQPRAWQLCSLGVHGCWDMQAVARRMPVPKLPSGTVPTHAAAVASCLLLPMHCKCRSAPGRRRPLRTRQGMPSSSASTLNSRARCRAAPMASRPMGTTTEAAAAGQRRGHSSECVCSICDSKGGQQLNQRGCMQQLIAQFRRHSTWLSDSAQPCSRHPPVCTFRRLIIAHHCSAAAGCESCSTARQHRWHRQPVLNCMHAVWLNVAPQQQGSHHAHGSCA